MCKLCEGEFHFLKRFVGLLVYYLHEGFKRRLSRDACQGTLVKGRLSRDACQGTLVKGRLKCFDTKIG